MQNKTSLWIIGANDGVGKTTLSVAMTDILELAGRSLRLVEVNGWRGLSRFMGDENVSSFESVLSLVKIRKDPNAILHQYDAVISEIEKGDSLLHFDAKATFHLFEYLKASGVDKDFSDMGVQVIVLIPAVADGHSLSGALALIDTASTIIPSARLVLVLNEYRGQNFGADFEMARFSLRARGISVMNMPQIMPEGWGDFQRNGNRFKSIISMDLAHMRELHGYLRPLARRAQNDISSWFEKMKAEVSNLPLVGLDQARRIPSRRAFSRYWPMLLSASKWRSLSMPRLNRPRKR